MGALRTSPPARPGHWVVQPRGRCRIPVAGTGGSVTFQQPLFAMDHDLHLINVASPGQSLSPVREEIYRRASALLLPWLRKALVYGRRLALPLPALQHFSADVVEMDGALLVTIWAPAGSFRPERIYQGRVDRLATIAIARDASSGQLFWDTLLVQCESAFQDQPPAPWCAVAVDRQSIRRHCSAREWIDDLADSLAWCWLVHQDRTDSALPMNAHAAHGNEIATWAPPASPGA